MIRRTSTLGKLLQAGVLLLAVSAGCTKEIPIVQYPVFWQPGEIQSIAVVPFRNTSPDDPEAGNAVADRLATALAANGTYERVYNRRDMQTLMTEQDLAQLAGGQGDTASLLSRLTNVQAIITGTVTSFEATSQSETRREPTYFTDRHGNVRQGRDKVFTYTTNDAIISAAAQLLSQRTGKTIHAVISPAQSHIHHEGHPPKMSMDACMAVALDNVIYQLVEQFAVIQKTIKVKPKDTFFSSTGERYHAEWTRQDDFATTDEKMAMVVAMPAEVDRNPFSIVIVRKDTKVDLAETSFVWSRDNPAYGVAFEFCPRELAAAGGAGDYLARLYVDDTPVLEHKFRIRPPQ